MNTMRIILIALGLAFLGGIWWWERRWRNSPPPDPNILDLDGKIHIDGGTDISDLSELNGITATGVPGIEESPALEIKPEAPGATEEVESTEIEEKLIVISLVAPPERPYLGNDLLVAIQNANLVYGEMNIFHHLIKGQRRALFSMANLVEPGTFNPPAMENFSTPGVIFFMRLPCVLKGSLAFERMLKSAQTLAAELGGNLYDQRRRPLDRAGINKLREELSKY